MAPRRDRRSGTVRSTSRSLFTTDPAISGSGFIELQDDRGLQPAENVTPILRTEVVDEFGSSLVDPVNEVSARLTTDVLRDLNEQMSHGESARTVASRWLGAQGLR